MSDPGADRDWLEKGDPRRPEWVPDRLRVYLDGNAIREARYGQYVLPGYAPGQPGNHDGLGKTYQRATTLISKIESYGDGLDDWKVGTGFDGLIRNPALLVEWAKTPVADKRDPAQGKLARDADGEYITGEDGRPITVLQNLKRLRKAMIERAHEAGGGNEASRNGDEIHLCTEWVDKDGSIDELPEAYPGRWPEGGQKWRKHVEAYLALKESCGILTAPKLVERQVVNSFYGAVGTFDRIVLFRRAGEAEARFRLLDIKSGDVDYRDKFGRQMLLYATADAMWDVEEQAYEPLPQDLDQDGCLVVHIPWWEADPEVSLLWVPFEGASGQEGLDACKTIRTIRKARKHDPLAAVMAPRPSFADRLTAATTADEIKEIGKEAVAAGAMTLELKALGKARMADVSQKVA